MPSTACATSMPSPLNVASTGSGEPPVVLVHGFGAHGGFWRGWVPELSRHHRVHNVDLMGFGSAPAPWFGDYSPSAQAERLTRFVRRTCGQESPPVLVGHSLGAGIALLAALELASEGRGPTIAGLVIVSGAVYPQTLPRYISLARRPFVGDLFLLAPPPANALKRGLQGVVHAPQSVTSEQVDTYREPLRDLRKRRATIRAARQIDPSEGFDLAARLADLDAPALIVWGEEDPIIDPDRARRLAGDISGSRLVTLEGVGHLPPEEAPSRSLRPVLDFLGSLSRNGRAHVPAPT